MSNSDRLCITRKDGERGLIAMDDSVEFEIRVLEVRVNGSEGRLIQAAREIGQIA